MIQGSYKVTNFALVNVLGLFDRCLVMLLKKPWVSLHWLCIWLRGGTAYARRMQEICGANARPF